DFFIGTQTDWARRGVPRRFICPVLSSAKGLNGLNAEGRPRAKRRFLLALKGHSLVPSLKRYLRTVSKAEIKSNVTFQKRSKWYALETGKVPDAVMASVFHYGPRLIINRGHEATNVFYRIDFVGGNKTLRRLVAISIQTSLSQLAAEL